ncbi:hypothetical protein JOF56_006970 [Kibdelosporangium banguiense]|uniref:Uncharacterized protein n=1 Tax=Kibdelosporangium banguiense TaxID=1365924 RepID=A0ABS4TRL5_9PSEU|nr:hypothetical protein [Kibdelosporangium banguiense]
MVSHANHRSNHARVHQKRVITSRFSNHLWPRFTRALQNPASIRYPRMILERT